MQGCVDLRVVATALKPKSALTANGPGLASNGLDRSGISSGGSGGHVHGGVGGLKALSARLLLRVLDKGLQRSDWGAEELSSQQVGVIIGTASQIVEPLPTCMRQGISHHCIMLMAFQIIHASACNHHVLKERYPGARMQLREL